MIYVFFVQISCPVDSLYFIYYVIQNKKEESKEEEDDGEKSDSENDRDDQDSGIPDLIKGTTWPTDTSIEVNTNEEELGKAMDLIAINELKSKGILEELLPCVMLIELWFLFLSFPLCKQKQRIDQKL